MKAIEIRHVFESHPVAQAWREKAGSMADADVRSVLDSILQTLDAWHRHGRWHGMLSLDDVWQDADGSVQVLPPRMELGGTDMDARMRGYAAFERHGAGVNDAADGARADIHAACAIAWTLMEGRRPPCALQRAIEGEAAEALVEQTTAAWSDHGLGEAVRRGMAFFPEGRPSDIASLRVLLGRVPDSLTAPAEDILPVTSGMSVDDIVPEVLLEEETQASAMPAGPKDGMRESPACEPPAVCEGTEQARELPKYVENQAVKRPEPAPVGMVALVLLALVLGLGGWWWLGQGEKDPADAIPAQGMQASPDSVAQESRRDGDEKTDMPPAQPQPQALPGTAMEEPGSLAGYSLDQRQEERGSSDGIGQGPALAGMEDTASRGVLPENPGEADVLPIQQESTQEDVGHSEGEEAGSVDEAKSTAGREQEPSSAAPVRVSLDIAPWAEIYVDGVSRGVSPPMKSLQLAPGTYRIELRNASQAPVRQTLEVRAGGGASIAHRFSSGSAVSQ
ncbi:hypothetical protein [Paracandidimonas soli]|uniref:PEGA domain-containing protein n=1 Tax=Paracandidimonas soli TaxID=1917182 RepID=A0A4R3UQD4_9BURK|nr:hypothetical protein [Paracandidimonas soli]TCU92991.1 hypothetical protein EV686_11312 [Paracandidimonas soli]